MSRNNPEKHKKILLESLERNMGLVTKSCKEVGLSEDIYYYYMKKDPEFKSAVDMINSINIDFAEFQLMKKIKEGSSKDIQYYLSRKGRSRGYGYNVDINVIANEIKWKSSNDNIIDDDNDIDDIED